MFIQTGLQAFFVKNSYPDPCEYLKLHSNKGTPSESVGNICLPYSDVFVWVGLSKQATVPCYSGLLRLSLYFHVNYIGPSCGLYTFPAHRPLSLPQPP